MFGVLVKKQMQEIFRSYFYDQKKNRARSKAAIAGYIVFFAVLMVGVIGGIFTFLASMMCTPLYESGMSWLYFVIMGLISVFLGALGSVFNTYQSLYLSKDNDLLLSMPIPVKALILSRLLSVYLMGLIYSAAVSLPAVIVSLIKTPVSAGTVFGGIIFVFLISVFVLTLSCLLGWVVAKISVKVKNKSFVTVFISLLFIGGYYLLYYKAQNLIFEIVKNAAVYGSKIKASAYFVYLCGMAATGDIKAVLIVTAVVAVLFCLTYRLLSHGFIKIAASSASIKRRKYVEKRYRKRKLDDALAAKEFKRFFSSPNYMLNCSFGTVFMPVAGVLLVIKRQAIANFLTDAYGERAGKGAVQIIIVMAFCILASMNNITAPSVSLEGKSLWIYQSMPIPAWKVLEAKFTVQFVMTAVPVSLFLIPELGMSHLVHGTDVILTGLCVDMYIAFMAFFGLAVGLKMPNLTWTNEIAPIKQSAPVAITLLAGMLFAAVPFGLYLITGMKIPYYMCLAIHSAVFAVLTAITAAWVYKKGAKIFSQL